MQVVYDPKPLTLIEAAAARERARMLKKEFLKNAPAFSFLLWDTLEKPEEDQRSSRWSHRKWSHKKKLR